MKDTPRISRLKWCGLAATAMTILSLLPQFHFWWVRGSNWQGAYTILQPDEPLYSAYVNALIDGRPRRNDPAAGRDDHQQSPMAESLFSIQFVPAYFVALPARMFHVSASTAFIVLNGIAALLTSLALFSLLSSIMPDYKTTALGVLVVLCFGALAANQGLAGLLFNPDVKFLGLPFLRAYEPSAPFPLFLVFCTLILTSLKSRERLGVKPLLAGLIFGLLLFSYFYLWTAALAWFACLIVLSIVSRSIDRGHAIKVSVIAAVPAVLAFAAYFYFISQLPPVSDRAWTLLLTRRPDLVRVPEIIGIIVIALVVIIVRRKKLLRDERPVFAISFALFPFLVFNQQILTGRAIQPFHYEVLIANYSVLIAAVIALSLLKPTIRTRTAILIASGCLLWALVEVSLSVNARLDVNQTNDETVPVLLRLNEYAKTDDTWNGLRSKGRAETLVFSPEYRVAGLLPTWAPHGTLLATGSAAFQSESAADLKRRLYEHLYYCGRNKEYLAAAISDRTDDSYESYYLRAIIFGPERHQEFLGEGSHPIRQDEIEAEASDYADFINTVVSPDALKYPIRYAVVRSDARFDFSHIDRWYEREAGEQAGLFVLYRLKLRRD